MADTNNPLKADLKITLQAGDTIVAISDDASLWQAVFAAMTKNNASLSSPSTDLGTSHKPKLTLPDGTLDPIEKFSKQIGITPEEVIGACSPSTEAPYISLDMHYWNTMRKKVSSKGTGSVSDISIAATILCYWLKTAKINVIPSIKDCQDLLSTIGLEQANAKRSINNASWLQLKPTGITINPAKMDQALSYIQAYCNASVAV